MEHPRFRLTLTRLRDPDTLYELRHFLTYLTGSTVTLSKLDLIEMHYDPQSQTFHADLGGPRDLAYQLYFHTKTFYSDYTPTLELHGAAGLDGKVDLGRHNLHGGAGPDGQADLANED